VSTRTELADLQRLSTAALDRRRAIVVYYYVYL
jgi:hypothetical protein